MKTAISIPDHLFDDGERLAARFQTSRSELYARALAEFVARHDDDRVTQALDRVADEVEEDAAGIDEVRKMARRTLRRVEW